MLFSTRQPKGISQNQCGHFTRSNGGSVRQKKHNWLIIIPQHVGAGGLICTIFILTNSNDENLTCTVHLFMTATSGKICRSETKHNSLCWLFFFFTTTLHYKDTHKWEAHSTQTHSSFWNEVCADLYLGNTQSLTNPDLLGPVLLQVSLGLLQHTCVVKQDLICPEHQFSVLSLFLGGLKQPHKASNYKPWLFLSTYMKASVDAFIM